MLLSIVNDISSSDIVFYVLIVILTIVLIILFYLIYNQNKEMNKRIKNSSLCNEEKVKDSYDLSNKPEISKVTTEKIPDYLELTQSFHTVSDEDLQSISESIDSREAQTLKDYEDLQEETAIISYDELVNKNKEQEESKEFKHEEDYLKSLKQLIKSLNN